MRTVARMLLPSTRQPMIWARFSVLSLFILTILLERPNVKRISQAPGFCPAETRREGV